MNEVKSPKKPMLYYYAMALLVLLLKIGRASCRERV